MNDNNRNPGCLLLASLILSPFIVLIVTILIVGGTLAMILPFLLPIVGLSLLLFAIWDLLKHPIRVAFPWVDFWCFGIGIVLIALFFLFF